MRGNKRPAKTYEDKFVGVNLSLLNSPAYIALDRAAQALFFDLRVKLNGFNNGNINAALSELKHRGWTSPATLAKALRQLEVAGFIAKTRQTIGVVNGSKVCNLYRFTDAEVFELPKLFITAKPATHEYRAFKNLTDAKRAVMGASNPKARSSQNKSTLQKLKRHDTETVALSRFDATETVFAPKKPIQKMKRQFASNGLQTQ